MKCRNCGTEFPDNLRQCPTCGQQRSEDDLFRRPEEDKSPAPASEPNDSPAFSFPISRQEPQPSKAEEIPETEETEDSEKSSSLPEVSHPDSKQKKLSWKPWQKITASVLILVLVAVSVFLLWPRSANLPAETLLYKKNGALMAFVPGQEPWTITTEPGNISNYSMKQVPEGQGLIWEHVSTGGLYYQPIGGERVELAAENAGASQVSSNGKYIYYRQYESSESPGLYQYRISDGQNRLVKDLQDSQSWYLWQDGSKIVVSLSGTIEIINADTLEVIWTREDVTYILPGEYTNALYFLVDRELWCWDSESGEEKKLLDGFMTYYLTEDGALYCQVSTGTQIALSELLENDLPGEEGEALLKKAEGIMVTTPESALYYYDGGEPVKLGEDLRLSRVSNSENLLAISIDYAAEYKMPLSEMKESLTMMGGEEDLEAVVVPNWPYEVGTTSLLLQGKTYELTLPEELSGSIALMEIAGDHVVAAVRGADSAQSGIWVGKIQDDTIVDDAVYPNLLAYGYHLTESGDLYYWLDETIGPLYLNGEVLEEEVNVAEIQYTEDGALYYLAEPSAKGWTLKCRTDGQTRELAKQVADYMAYTRDFAYYLSIEDNGMNLMSSTRQGAPEVIDRQVDSLYEIQEMPFYGIA